MTTLCHYKQHKLLTKTDNREAFLGKRPSKDWAWSNLLIEKRGQTGAHAQRENAMDDDRVRYIVGKVRSDERSGKPRHPDVVDREEDGSR